MSTGTPAPPGADPAESLRERVAEAQAAWKAEAKALSRLATAVGPLTRPAAHDDLAKLEATVAKVARKLEDMPEVAERSRDFLDLIREQIRQRKEAMRSRLAAELRAACEGAGLTMKVVRREEPVEVRIPPFAVVIDREKGRAELRFARLPLSTCPADAGAIVEAHRRACESMRKGFDPDRFFRACHTAWLAARGAGKDSSGGRVEILDLLPYLALQMQPRSFQVDPVARNYRGYPRARFAFDLLGLRRAGALVRDGWRLNLGVATGTTASRKDRALFVEDEHGDGEYKLTIYFTPAGSAT